MVLLVVLWRDVVVGGRAALGNANVQTSQQSNTGHHEQPEEQSIDNARQLLPLCCLVLST